MTGSLRIVRLANFVTPVSGGLRTALRHLGAGYLAAGHQPVLIIPARRTATSRGEGRVARCPARSCRAAAATGCSPTGARWPVR